MVLIGFFLFIFPIFLLIFSNGDASHDVGNKN